MGHDKACEDDTLQLANCFVLSPPLQSGCALNWMDSAPTRDDYRAFAGTAEPAERTFSESFCVQPSQTCDSSVYLLKPAREGQSNVMKLAESG